MCIVPVEWTLLCTESKEETADRWGVKEGQLSLASKIINSQVINRVVRQYIDDEISSADAVAKLNTELATVQ